MATARVFHQGTLVRHLCAAQKYINSVSSYRVEMTSNFDPLRDIPDLAGKTVLVTGGNAGLGAATVLAIAAHNPDNLFLCARTPSKAEAFIDEIRKEHPKTTTRAITLDLSSFDSIKACAKQVNDSCDKIDVLILNAGVSGLQPALTKDGYEIQTGTNHIGHALLTQLLMPKLHAASKTPGADTRIVVVASQAAKGISNASAFPIEDFKTELKSVNALRRYQISKLANVYFAQSLAKEYPDIISTAIHPGLVFTEIWGKALAFPRVMQYIAIPVVRLFGLTATEGARNQLWAGFGKGVESGKYYEPVAKDVPGNKLFHSEEMRDKLWEWTNNELAAHGAPGWQ